MPSSRRAFRPGLLPRLRRFPLTAFAATLGVLAMIGWWHSSHYSERHLFYLGNRTIETFSASSLLRISFVNGHVPRLGARTFYRQRNARGKFLVRPVVPSFRSQPDVWEVTLGYWHLVALASGLALVAGFGEGWRVAGPRRAGGRLHRSRTGGQE